MALFCLSDEAWTAIEPHLPKNQPGARGVDDQRVISGIMHVLKVGSRWCDYPADYGPSTTIYNCFNNGRSGGSGCNYSLRWSTRRDKEHRDRQHVHEDLLRFLQEKGAIPVIPGRCNRKRTIRYDKQRYRGRHLVENALCRLKDFRRIATHYEKLAANFLSAVSLATA